MAELIIYLKNNLAEHFVIYFIPLYYLGGRPIALISAQLLGYKISFLLPVAVMLDTLQIPLFYHLYDSIAKRPFMQKLARKGKLRETRQKRSELFQWLRNLGMPGIIIITMLPLKGCGILSGFILSRLLLMTKTTAYALLIIGSILGCLILFGVGELILESWNYITKCAYP
jgi:uncharacterized membrane protein